MISLRSCASLIVILAAAAGGGQAATAAPHAVCPPVQNTLDFTIAYGAVQINGAAAPAGAAVEARNPRGETVGCFVADTAGGYGLMYVYGEDVSVAPAIPGMRAGETVAFYVNGCPAAAAPALVWAGDKDSHRADLSAVCTPPPVASFTLSPSSGTRPLTVVFTDTSTGSITAWSWAFGDGGASAVRHPTHTYTSAGAYTVTLTVTGPGGSDPEVRPNAVVVSEPKPVAAFTLSPASGVRPLTVAFTDTSTGGPATTWAWTFGDGGTSALRHPTHTYTSAGAYTVTLTVTGPGGSDPEVRPNAVVVAEQPPVASFTLSPASGVRPLTVAFTDTSTGGPATAWAWAFGDGGTSTLRHSTHTYTSAGAYTVTLTVTGPGGSDPEVRPNAVVVSQPKPVASFTLSPASGVRPLTVTFTDTSTGGPATAWAWAFGDGGVSTLRHPTHIYASASAYTVTLTVTGPGGSDPEVRPNAVVVSEPKPVAAFSLSPASGVRPLTVAFTDTSTGGPVTAWAWTFGDGGTSALRHPTHTYASTGAYTVTLTVTGPGGSDPEVRPNAVVVSESKPVASFSLSPASGERPLTVTFTDTSTGVITSQLWLFGDGGSSTAPRPAHQYGVTGAFTVTLTVTGPGGSNARACPRCVTVLEPPERRYLPIAMRSG
jgi:PKD repeat protein